MFKSKVYRLLCLLFVFTLCFQSFGLGVSAAEESNLVEDDLREWTNVYPETTTVAIDANHDNSYRVIFSGQRVEGTNTYIKAGLIYDLTNLVSGHSYNLSFHLLDSTQAGNAESFYYRGFEQNGGRLIIGLCSYNKKSDDLTLVDNAYIEITEDNYLDYFGEQFVISFELPNIVNPCVIIRYEEASTNTYSQHLFIKDVSLVDNEQSDEEGFFTRLFEWFQQKFDAIGESFSNLGDKLSDVKDSFVNKLTELKTSFENKINDLKESFQNKINELKQGLIDLKNNLINGIKSLFVPDEESIKTFKDKLDLLLKNHLGIIYTCSDLFKSMLEDAFEIINTSPDSYQILIPEVTFDVGEDTVPVFPAGDDAVVVDGIRYTSIDFSFMEKPVFKTLYGMYTVAMYIFFGALEVKYALRVYRKVMSN